MYVGGWLVGVCAFCWFVESGKKRNPFRFLIKFRVVDFVRDAKKKSGISLQRTKEL